MIRERQHYPQTKLLADKTQNDGFDIPGQIFGPIREWTNSIEHVRFVDIDRIYGCWLQYLISISRYRGWLKQCLPLNCFGYQHLIMQVKEIYSVDIVLLRLTMLKEILQKKCCNITDNNEFINVNNINLQNILVFLIIP